MFNSYRNYDKEHSDNKLQNIPSGNNEIRMMFVPSTTEKSVTINDLDNTITFDKICEVETTSGWVLSSKLNVGDILISTDEFDKLFYNEIVQINDAEDKVIVFLK